MKKKELKKEKELDDVFFQPEVKEKMTEQEVVSLLTEEDLLDLIEGKKIYGLKVTK